eukprot:1931229-Rhodomonas_salina.1
MYKQCVRAWSRCFASQAAMGLSAKHSSLHHQDICFATCHGSFSRVACSIQGICFATCSGPFSRAWSRAAFKAFASQPAVGLSARLSRVLHSRHLLRDLQWAFQPGWLRASL